MGMGCSCESGCMLHHDATLFRGIFEAIYSFLIAVTAVFGIVLQGRPDLLKDAVVAADFTNSSELTFFSPVASSEGRQHDLIGLLEMSFPVRTCLVVWLVLNFIAGLMCGIILLQGAQERNLLKVKVWFFVTIVSYLLWIPVYAYWICYAAVEPVNVLMSGFMTYMLGGLCLWVVSGFIEELRIESISHRVGYKDVPFYKI